MSLVEFILTILFVMSCAGFIGLIFFICSDDGNSDFKAGAFTSLLALLLVILFGAALLQHWGYGIIITKPDAQAEDGE